jgi:hypothetical protein
MKHPYETKVYIMMVSGGSTVVELSTHNLKIEGSKPAAVAKS